MFDVSTIVNDYLVLLGVNVPTAFFFNQALALEKNKIENEIDKHLDEFLINHRRLYFNNLQALKQALYKDSFKMTLNPDYLTFLYKVENSIKWAILISLVLVGSLLVLQFILPMYGFNEKQEELFSNVISSYGCIITFVTIGIYFYYFNRVDWRASLKEISKSKRFKEILNKL